MLWIKRTLRVLAPPLILTCSVALCCFCSSDSFARDPNLANGHISTGDPIGGEKDEGSGGGVDLSGMVKEPTTTALYSSNELKYVMLGLRRYLVVRWPVYCDMELIFHESECWMVLRGGVDK